MMATGLLPPRLLPALELLLQEKLGHRVGDRRLMQLADAVTTLATEGGYAEVEEYLALARTLPVDAPLVQSLVRAITNKESYFFRDAATMCSLRECVLPQLFERNKNSRILRVWSAGCSTGEELYSISILLQELLPDYDRWTVTLLGTDIDSGAVARARRGEYKSWSLRATSEAERKRYFEAREGVFRLRPRYRKNVSFGLHNLADASVLPPAPGTFDLIFCRNVLIYFGPDGQTVVKRKFKKALSSGGAWIGGPSDPSPGQGWTTDVSPGLLVHRPGHWDRASGSTPESTRQRHWEPNQDSNRQLILPNLESVVHTPSPAKGPAPTSSVSPTTPPSDSAMRAQTDFPAGPGARRETPTVPVRRQAGTTPLPSGQSTREESLLESARRAADAGQLTLALETLAEVISENPLLPRAYLMVATIQQSLGQPEAAIVELKRAIYLDPSDCEAHLRLGFLLAAQGGREAAIRAFRTAVLLASAHEDPEPDLQAIRESAAAQVVRLLGEERQ